MSTSFRRPLILKFLDTDDPKCFELYEEFEYKIGNDPDNIIYIPEGFRTDFGSVPSIFQPIIKPVGKHGKACLVHDFLCIHGKEYGITRKEADELFLEAMEALEVGWLKRHTMYRAVRLYSIFTRKK
jgi:hypothetical protein